MANKKRDRNAYRKELGRHRLSRVDLLTIEKILWLYSDTMEAKNTKTKTPDGRKHMPRKTIDRFASIGRYRPFHLSFDRNEFGIHYAGVDWISQEDSVKFLRKRTHFKRVWYLELAAWPGVKVTFTPFSTIIYAQTHYATGNELKNIRVSVKHIERYLASCRVSWLNNINIS